MMMETFSRLGTACEALKYSVKAGVQGRQAESDEVMAAFLECTKEGLWVPRLMAPMTLFLVAADQLGAAKRGGDYGPRTLDEMQSAFDSMARDMALLIARVYYGLDEPKQEEAPDSGPAFLSAAVDT